MATNNTNKNAIVFSDSSVITVNGRSIPVKDLSFSDIRCHYETGRNITEKSIGQYVRNTYRVGVMTNVGDIEKAEWEALVMYLIEKNGEQELFNSMMEWYKSNHKWATRSYVLQCYASRLFDDKGWCDFIPFNAKYRPDKVAELQLNPATAECYWR